MKVWFVHPDLGIGGAERLVVDAALALQRCGHDVRVYTNRFSPAHCFEEVREGRIAVQTVGSWLPRHVFGRCRALCAYLRLVYAALYLALFVVASERPDVVFCDLVPVCIPVFKLFRRSLPIIYYCHFPDKLLTDRKSVLKRAYRAPIDWLEERSTAAADRVLVNSEFTAGVFKRSFPNVYAVPEVCYPSIDTAYFDKIRPKSLCNVLNLQPTTIVLLSINRYERKKGLELALTSLQTLQESLPENDSKRIHLVMAGGYDPLNFENIAHYEELRQLTAELRLEDRVTFLKSPSDVDKVSLLFRSDIVVYTPTNEHFGIVPLEAMYCAKPVVAINSGGPTETIVHDVTGYLCEPTAASFASALKKLVIDPNLRKNMGEAGKKRFKTQFSFEAFTERFDNVIKNQKLIKHD